MLPGVPAFVRDASLPSDDGEREHVCVGASDGIEWHECTGEGWGGRSSRPSPFLASKRLFQGGFICLLGTYLVPALPSIPVVRQELTGTSIHGPKTEITRATQPDQITATPAVIHGPTQPFGRQGRPLFLARHLAGSGCHARAGP